MSLTESAWLIVGARGSGKSMEAASLARRLPATFRRAVVYSADTGPSVWQGIAETVDLRGAYDPEHLGSEMAAALGSPCPRELLVVCDDCPDAYRGDPTMRSCAMNGRLANTSLILTAQSEKSIHPLVRAQMDSVVVL